MIGIILIMFNNKDKNKLSLIAMFLGINIVKRPFLLVNKLIYYLLLTTI